MYSRSVAICEYAYHSDAYHFALCVVFVSKLFGRQVLLEQFKRIARRSLFVQTAEPADLFAWTCHDEFLPKKIATKKLSSKYLQSQMEMEGLVPSTELLAHFADRVSISQSSHKVDDDDDELLAAAAPTRGRSESKVASLAKRVKNGGEAALPSRLKTVNGIPLEAATVAALAAAAPVVVAAATAATATSSVTEPAALVEEEKPQLPVLLVPGADRFLAPLPSTRVVNSTAPRNLAGRRASLVPEDQCSSAVAPADLWTALPSQRPWMLGPSYPNLTGRRRVWF